MSDLLKLAERCALATEGDRELDLEILRAITNKYWLWCSSGQGAIWWNQYGAGAPGNPVMSLEEFTESVDDALRLVPEGRGWNLQGNTTTFYATVFGKTGQACTPALALCAAALRARARAAVSGSGDRQ